MSELSQEEATRLLNEGALLVIHEVPEGTEFGIDYNSWNVGPLFRGVKMIPAGFHFIYYSAVSKTGDTAPRTGLFCNFKPAEVVVMRWNSETEEILESNVSNEEKQRYREGILEMDRFLGAYPRENSNKWISLTNYISDVTLRNLLPVSRRVCSVPPVSQSEGMQSSSSSTTEESGHAEVEQSPASESQIRFTSFSLRDFPSGSTPEEITRHSMDKSFILDTMLNKLQNGRELLAELQFSFVCFLVGQVYEGFEQWKKLLHLLCMCDKALGAHSEMYYELIGVLHYQLLEMPLDFIMDIVSASNFLTATLQELFSRIESASNLTPKLVQKAGKFKSYLTKKYGLDFDEESDDFAPVVVQL